MLHCRHASRSYSPRRSPAPPLLCFLYAFVALLAPSARAQVNIDPVWASRYDTSKSIIESAQDVAVDSQGNVILAGYAEEGGNRDYLTVKYDKNGVFQWIARYNGSANNSDEARAVAVDGSDNIYVTGRSRDPDTTYRMTTIKYSPGGDQLWVNRYDGSGPGSDDGRGILADSQGNVYVAGTSAGLNTSNDIVLVKYDTAGTQLWIQRQNDFDGIGAVLDSAVAMTFDSAGNICIVGNTTSSSTNLGAILVLEYSPDKPQLWKALFDASVKVTAAGVAAGPNGSIYVSGYNVRGNNGNDYLTIKYDAAGSQTWFRYWKGDADRDDIPTGIAADKWGGVYVTGTSKGATDATADMATVKWDADGNEQWAKTYNGSFGGADFANGIAVDDKGNAYITGQSEIAAGDADTLTIKYGPSGQPVWIGRFTVAGRSDVARRISVDKDGNVVVGGTSGSGSGSDDALAIKYSPFLPLDMSVGGDGRLRLLTRRADGQAAILRLLDPATGAGLSSLSLNVPKDVTPQALATAGAAGAGVTYLLWQRSDGQAQIWQFPADLSTITTKVTFGPLAGQRPVDLAVGKDGKVRLIWRGTASGNRNEVTTWRLNPALSAIEDAATFGPPLGAPPLAVSVGPDDLTRLLWSATTPDSSAVWMLRYTAGSGAPSGSNWGPFDHMRIQDMCIGFDAKARLLWQRLDGGSGDAPGDAELHRLDLSGKILEHRLVLGSPQAGSAVALHASADLVSRPVWVLWEMGDGRIVLRAYDPTSGAWSTQFVYSLF